MEMRIRKEEVHVVPSVKARVRQLTTLQVRVEACVPQLVRLLNILRVCQNRRISTNFNKEGGHGKQPRHLNHTIRHLNHTIRHLNHSIRHTEFMDHINEIDQAMRTDWQIPRPTEHMASLS